MYPVIGLDIAKGESQGQAFLDKGQPYGKSFTVQHTREGLDAFHSFLKLIENETLIEGDLASYFDTVHQSTPFRRFLYRRKPFPNKTHACLIYRRYYRLVEAVGY